MSSPPPAETDVVVIGAGIIGASTALFLAESGLRVTVCEKHRIACEQSSRNWGWVRQMGRNPAEIPLAMTSLDIWRSFRQCHGIETGYAESGIAYLCRTGAERSQAEGWALSGNEMGLDLKLLADSELARLFPGLHPDFGIGLYNANDGRAEPALATHAIIGAAGRSGASIHEKTAVRGIETTTGRVSGVVTENSEIRCSAVVVAAGVWTRRFLGNVGVDFPQLAVLATAARIECEECAPETAASGGDFAFRKRLDGGYTIACRSDNVAPLVPASFIQFRKFMPAYLRNRHKLSLRLGGMFFREAMMPGTWQIHGKSPFESHRVLNPAPVRKSNFKALDSLKWALPTFADARITHHWSGLIDVTPDELPVIGGIDDHPGLFVASGFSGHGFGIGPGAGKLMAQMVTGESTVTQPDPFRFDRPYVLQ